MMLRLILLTVSLLSLAVAQAPLRIEPKRIEKKLPGCIVTFEYPEIISAVSPQARDRMNAEILRVLLRRVDWPAFNSGARSLDAYANVFLEGCAAVESEPAARGLYDHKVVGTFRYTPPILSFRCDSDADSGGVHPYGTTWFVNLDSRTGKAIHITDLLRQGALRKLESIAEAIFRRDHNLSSTENLAEQAWNFPGHRFRLNDNFGIGDSELVFVFNTYEIAAGAMGATEIKIPYRRIRDLLNPNLHLF
jgi:hypothetical protein